MITEEEFSNVSKRSPFDRYKYFLKRIADFEEVWSVGSNEGCFGLSDIDGHTLVSFWSDSEYAKQCLTGDWGDYCLIKLSLEELEASVFQTIDENGYLINVFPLAEKSGFVVDLDEFRSDLFEELENYE